MATENYCLRWNEHRSILVTNFERLLRLNTSVDCTLAAEGQCLRAHKVVLSACSPYFEMMLNQDIEKHPIIFMKDMKFKELQAIVEYIYRGEVVIPHDQLAALLQAAESLQLKGLGIGPNPVVENRGLNQQQRPSQQPVQQSLQVQQPQFLRPSPSAPRTSSANQESAPQVVDLTEDKTPTASSPVARLLLENAKRALPQAFVRAKRPALSNQNNNQVLTSQANFTVTNVTQAFTVQNVPVSTVTSPVSPAKPFSLIRQINEQATGSRPVNEVVAIRPVNFAPRIVTPPAAPRIVTPPAAPQIVTPPAQPAESQGIREPTKQLPVRTKPRILSNTPRKVVQANVSRNITPSPLPSQNLASAVLPKIVSVTSEKTVPATVNETDDIQPHAVTLPDPLDVNQRNSPEEIIDVGDSAQQNVCNESSKDQAGDPDAEKSPSDPQTDAASNNDPALSTPGPSRQGSGPPKSGRRGRTPMERRFQCPECQKKFTQKSYLDKHLRIHDGDCYQCDVCDKAFLTRAALIKHVRSHVTKPTPPSQHKCQLCEDVFPNAEDLEKHLTDHTLSMADDKE